MPKRSRFSAAEGVEKGKIGYFADFHAEKSPESALYCRKYKKHSRPLDKRGRLAYNADNLISEERRTAPMKKTGMMMMGMCMRMMRMCTIRRASESVSE